MLTFEQVLKLAKEHVNVEMRPLREDPSGPQAIVYPPTLSGHSVASFVSALLMDAPTVADLAASNSEEQPTSKPSPR